MQGTLVMLPAPEYQCSPVMSQRTPSRQSPFKKPQLQPPEESTMPLAAGLPARMPSNIPRSQTARQHVVGRVVVDRWSEPWTGTPT